jgi:hypothetical protein
MSIESKATQNGMNEIQRLNQVAEFQKPDCFECFKKLACKRTNDDLPCERYDPSKFMDKL